MNPAGAQPPDLPVHPDESYLGPAGTMSTRFIPDVERVVHRWNLGDVSHAISLDLPGDRTAATPPPKGSIYELDRMIGEGGMGEVWEARQACLDRIVAVKRMRPPDSPEVSGSSIGRGSANSTFHREALIAARLEHPNIIPVHDLGMDPEGNLLLAMKRVQGESWSATIRKDMLSMPWAQALDKHLRILVSVAQAVAFAHSRHIVHRDIKPSQVMVGEFGEVLLMDWGLSMYVGPEPGGGSRDFPLPDPETAGGPCGTPSLMAPEQTLPHARDIGPWTDIYLLGGTLYFILTGLYPHGAQTSEESFARAARGEVTPPSRLQPDGHFPSDLEAICLKALAAGRTFRYGSAKDFIDALQDYLSGAGRRAESEELTRSLGSGTSAWRRSYPGCAGALATLDRARELWAGNPALRPLREQILGEYVGFALERGDLGLAEAMALQMPEGGSRERLLAATRERARRQAAHAWQRRTALVASGLLVVVVALVVMRSNDSLRHANAALTTQRQVAVGARNDAERLVGYLLGDLHPKLRELHRSDILTETGERALDYYRSLPLSQQTPQTRGRHADACLDAAIVFRDNGRLLPFAAALDEARCLIDRELQQSPGNAEWLLRRGELEREAGNLCFTRSDYREALEHARTGLECHLLLWGGGNRSEPVRRGLINSLGEFQMQLGNVGDEAAALQASAVLCTLGPELVVTGDRETQGLRVQAASVDYGQDLIGAGRPAEAEALFRECLPIGYETYSTPRDKLIALGISYRAANALARMHLDRGEREQAVERELEMVAISREMVQQRRSEPDSLRDLMFGLIMGGDFLLRAGDPRGRDLLKECREVVMTLRNYDPENTVYAADLSSIDHELASAHLRFHDPAAALPLAREAAQMGAQIVAQTPRGMGLLGDLGANILMVSDALRALGDLEGATASARECVDVGERMVALDKGSADAVSAYSAARLALARCLLAGDRTDEATALLELPAGDAPIEHSGDAPDASLLDAVASDALGRAHLLALAGRDGLALDAALDAAECADAAAGAEPADPVLRTHRLETQVELGRRMARVGLHEENIAQQEQARGISQVDTVTEGEKLLLARSQRLAIESLAALGRSREALERSEAVAREYPSRSGMSFNRGVNLALLRLVDADCHAAVGEVEEARRTREEVLARVQDLTSDPVAVFDGADTVRALRAAALTGLGRSRDAEPDLQVLRQLDFEDEELRARLDWGQ